MSRTPARPGAFATAALIAAVAILGANPPTPALAAGGATTLALNGPAAHSLRAAGVRIAPAGPAKGGAARIVLPVRAGLAGTDATVLTHRGGISFGGPRGRTVRLRQIRLVLGKRSRVAARLGGRRLDLFKVLAGNRRVDPVAGTVELSRLRLKLTAAAAKAIAERLHLGTADRGARHSPARPGRFGTLAASVFGLSAPGAAPRPEEEAQAATGCPTPSGAGPAPEDPLPVATRPPAAVDVVAATLAWHVRESFIRYVATGEGTSVSGGATAGPPQLLPGASVPLVYDFQFPFASGWHDAGADPSSPADDRAAIYFGGAVRFLYSGHGIDLTTARPEIEIAGGGSRAIFTIAEGADPPRREVLVNLDLSRAASVSTSGNAIAYERVPGAIPSGAATSVFGGFYAPGAEFGCFDLTYRTG